MSEGTIRRSVVAGKLTRGLRIEQRLLLDASVEEVTGSLRLAASGPETNAARQMDFVRDGEMDFSLSVPLRNGVYDASLRADLLSTHVIPLPARVDLTHHEEGTWLANVPVIGRFVGFFHTVTSTLSAVWDPVYHTVSTHLSAFFGPVTRTLSATLQAAWDPVTETVGGWVSATVGTWLTGTVGSWLSATVGTMLSATVGSWLSATVGSWLSATVGSWLSTTVGSWLSTTVGSWLSTTVGTWLSATVGTWLSATVGTWLTGTVGTWLSATVGTWLTGTVGTWLSATVGTWLTGTVGTWLSTTVGTIVSATVGTVVSAVVGGFYTTVSHWVNIILGWLNINVWVPSEEASGYASDTASKYASGSATGYASGSATGYASDTATGYAEDTATGYASDTATGYASGEATAYASDTATGYASGSATGYASTQVTLPGRTEQTTVSETVTSPGQTVEQTVSETVQIPGRTAEREVSEDVWIEGIEVEQEVEVEVVIPAYTSAEVTETQPLVREYRESAYGKFAFLSDAPYEPLPDPPEGSEVPSEAAQYVLLLEEEDDEDDDGGEDTTQGQVGRDVAALVGGTLLNLVDGVIRSQEALPAQERKRVTVVVDEMQAIPGADYEAMLSELGKFGASFVMATQSLTRLEDLSRTLRETIFSNIGCLVSFQVSASDARYLTWELDRDQVTEEDLTSLPVHHCYVRATVGGDKLPTFSMALRPPYAGDTEAAEAVLQRVSEYTLSRSVVTTRLEEEAEKYVRAFRRDVQGVETVPIDEGDVEDASPDGNGRGRRQRRSRRTHEPDATGPDGEVRE